MGGFGSGNHYHWWRPAKKATVEHCRSLDASRLMREGVLKADVWQHGSWVWYRDATRTEQASCIGYEVNTRGEPPWLRLFYTVTATKEAIDYRVRLTTTRPRFGGLRWWFVCPLVVNGRACGRRVGKLYLRPGGRYFGCRHCHALTYTSCQEHDPRVTALRNNPNALGAIMDDPKSASADQLILALKALRRGK
jgi:hypothetical protein